ATRYIAGSRSPRLQDQLRRRGRRRDVVAGDQPARDVVEQRGGGLTALPVDAALGGVEQDRDDVPRVVGGQDAGAGDTVVRGRGGRRTHRPRRGRRAGGRRA